MSFSDEIKRYKPDEVAKIINSRTDNDVLDALSKETLHLQDFAALVSPAAKKYLAEMGEKSAKITRQRFGKTIKIYAPLYVSNDCVNSCVYCGFNRTTGIERINLSDEQIEREASFLSSVGIDSVVIVSGDNVKSFSNERLNEAVRICKKYFSQVAVEVRALDVEDYKELKLSGADGYTMFQETYIEENYEKFHLGGPKKNFKYRLDCPERAAQAGLRHVGLGSLLGLSDFRLDIFYMSLHAKYLMDKFWQCHISASFPRIRSSAGNFNPAHDLSDANLFQMIFAFRLFLHDAGINISTRETAALRDKLMPLGATIMSAGSKTEPGGYSKPKEDASQFSVEDARSVSQFCDAVRKSGLEPVMKDWDGALNG